LTETAGLTAKAVDLRPYKDTDELINADAELWAKRVDEAAEIPEFVIEVFKDDYDLSSSRQKEKLIVMVLPYIKRIQSQIRTDHYLEKLSRLTDIKYEIIAEMLDKLAVTAVNTELEKPEDNPSEGAEEIVEPSKTAVRKLNKRLQKLLAYIYDYAQRFGSQEQINELHELAQSNLPRKEATLIDAALRIEDANYAEHIKLLAEIVTTNKESEDFVANEDYKDIRKLLLKYILYRIKDYIKLSKQESLDLHRIKAYTEKITQIEVLLLNS
jgi:DNA primase